MSALARGQAQLPDGCNAEEVVGKMISEIAQGERPALRAKGLGKGGKQSQSQNDSLLGVLHDASACRECKGFVLANNSPDVRKHSAYLACMSKLRSAFCTCVDPGEDAGFTSCDFHHESTHTIADFTWGLATLMEQESIVPASVPAVGAAAVQLGMIVQEMADKQTAEAAERAAKGDIGSEECAKAARTQD